MAGYGENIFKSIPSFAATIQKFEELEIKDADIEVQDEISHGEFGTVCNGLWNGKPVALKFLKNEAQVGAQSLLKEALIMREVKGHPNLVECFGLWRMEEEWAIVMEKVDGQSLKDILSQPGISSVIPVEKKFSVAIKCWKGLAFINIEKNALHCDIHPGNILVSEDYEIVKIADFGFSKVRKHLSKSWTSTEPLWHYLYTAPEVAKIGNKRHKTSDVFSLGVVTAELFAERSFWKKDIRRKELVRLLNRDETPYEALPIFREGQLSDTVKQVIEKAIEWDTGKRSTSDVILNDIEKCLQTTAQTKQA